MPLLLKKRRRIAFIHLNTVHESVILRKTTRYFFEGGAGFRMYSKFNKAVDRLQHF